MCKELKDLENNFEKDNVHVRHFTKSSNPRTEIAVVNGHVVHVGVARVSPNDSFNKPLGRLIAAGRADFAFKVFAGNAEQRDHETNERSMFRREPVHYTFVSTDQQSVEEFLEGFYAADKE